MGIAYQHALIANQNQDFNELQICADDGDGMGLC